MKPPELITEIQTLTPVPPTELIEASAPRKLFLTALLLTGTLILSALTSLPQIKLFPIAESVPSQPLVVVFRE